MFVHTLPLADLWQDSQWRARVEVLQGVTAIAPVSSGGAAPAAALAAAAAAAPGAGPSGGPRVSELGLGLGGGPPVELAGRVGEVAAAAVAARIRQPGSQRTGEAARMGFRGEINAGAAGSGAAGAGGNALAARSSTGGSRATAQARSLRRQEIENLQVLSWLLLKHEQELQLMKGQSSIWYFMESLHLSAVNLNVTIAVNSSIISSTSGSGSGGGNDGRAGSSAGGSGGGDGEKAVVSGGLMNEVQRQLVRGMLSRISGGMGYQLINVSNVGLHLAHKELSNTLVNSVGLSNLLIRHYQRQGLAEARKVLGGTGPGLLQIPASILWAGISVVDLAREIAVRKRSPLQMPPALMHVAFTMLSQIVGVSARFVMAVMAVVPMQRRGALSDHSALQRYVRTPRTAGDAFYQAIAEFYLGVCGGVAGLVLDPLAGARLPGVLALVGLAMGLVKGCIGLGVRPMMGAADSGSKVFRGVGLLFLGRRGIQGKLVRRVRPPGAAVGSLEDVQGLAGSGLAAVGGSSSWALGGVGNEAVNRAILLSAWQQSLGAVVPELAGDEVLEVMATRPKRLVLLTSRHIAYLRAVPRGPGNSKGHYSMRWYLPYDVVDHVRGAEDALRLVLEYRQKLVLAGLQMTLPLHHSLRCANPDVYQRVIKTVSRHLGIVRTGGGGATNAGRLPTLLGPGRGALAGQDGGMGPEGAGGGGYSDLEIM